MEKRYQVFASSTYSVESGRSEGCLEDRSGSGLRRLFLRQRNWRSISISGGIFSTRPRLSRHSFLTFSVGINLANCVNLEHKHKKKCEGNGQNCQSG
jgi:hypothetical protein